MSADRTIAEAERLLSLGPFTEGTAGAWICNALAASVRDLLAALASQKEEQQEAHKYLARLLTHHAPQCEPLTDLLGVCTQIDNLLTLIPKLRAEYDALEKRLEDWRAWCTLPHVGGDMGDISKTLDGDLRTAVRDKFGAKDAADAQMQRVAHEMRTRATEEGIGYIPADEIQRWADLLAPPQKEKCTCYPWDGVHAIDCEAKK